MSVFERFQAHQDALAAADHARLINPHTPLTVEWYSHALDVTERRATAAESMLEESRRQVDALREEKRQLRMQIEVTP